MASSGAEGVLGLAVCCVGIALTTIGGFGHLAQLIAPGSAMTLAGAAWLGNALARHDVRLFPRAAPRRAPKGS